MALFLFRDDLVLALASDTIEYGMLPPLTSRESR